MFFNVLLSILAVLYSHSRQLAAGETTTEIITTTSSPNSTLAELLPTTAEKLVRYRRQPPGKVKHYIRTSKPSKPRRRIKRPKIKYGPPSYSYVEPLSHHKSRPTTPEHPTFSFDEFKHLNFDASEFDFPPSSYEAQAMDLDFYSQDHTSYVSSKKPNIQYTFESEPETPPSYKYKIESSAAVSVPREPHQTYGVPKEYKYSTNFKHSSVGSNNYITDQHSLLEQHPAYESDSDDSAKYSSGWSGFSLNKHPPSSSYGTSLDFGSSYPSHISYKEPASLIPKYVAHSPIVEQSYGPPPSTKYDQKSQSHGSFSMYDKKLTNAAFRPSQHHFAEPPSTKTDIEITYSPSYEINIPPTSQIHPEVKYIEHPGNFAEPPDYSPEHVSVPEYTKNHSPAHAPPPPPAYQTPEHTAISPTISHDEFTPTHKELPLNPHHRQPAYDFPKSSYEVPIYDPIPFDSSNNNEQEYYPPHDFDFNNNNNNHHQDTSEYKQQKNFVTQEKYDHQMPRVHASESEHYGDTHSSSTLITTSTTKKPQKPIQTHKYGRGNSTITPINHILDVPELQEAFEAGKRKQLLDLNSDTETNESSNVEKTHYFLSSTMITPLATDNYVNQAWNPMRIRTSSRIIPSKQPVKMNPTPKFLPTVVPAIRQRPQTRFKHNNQGSSSSSELPDLLQKANISNSLGNIAILSIEKSRSHSYYDGTVPPPTSQPLTSTPKIHSTRFRMPTKLAPQSRKEVPSKHTTTKSVFETTYFKIPRNEREANKQPAHSLLDQNLPKNHKFY